MNLIFRCIYGLAIMLTGAAQAAETTGKYVVSVEARHNADLIGNPIVVVEEGVAATMEVSGDRGYRYVVKVTESGPKMVTITARFSSAHGTMAPTVTASLGKAVTVSVGGMNLVFRVSAERRNYYSFRQE